VSKDHQAFKAEQTGLKTEELKELFQTGEEAVEAHGDHVNALLIFQKIVKLDHERLRQHGVLPWMAWTYFGLCNYKLGRWEEARKAYELAISIWEGQRFGRFYKELGWVYSKLGRNLEMFEAFREAARLDPDPEIMYGLGLACSLTQQYEQQVWALKKAVQERPDFAEAYYQLGLGYSDLGYRRSAIKAFARAVQVKPDHAKAHFQLGLAYLSVNNEVLAHKQYKILKSVDRALAKKLMNLINGSASNTEDQT
jgi:tetratricopeptide (TPR) repeat protein